jgi:hypothetical protein
VDATPLVGRAAECAAIAGALEAFRVRPGGVVAIEGEPGIGKSRLLAHLAATAEGCTVVRARASEFEHDLPYAVWTEALDRHLADLGERRLRRLGMGDADALAAVAPALGGAGDAADRHRTHRALRDLLRRLAASSPLVVCFDDIHWADPASIDALAALLRRPPDGAVLLACAAREGQWPPALVAALADALREDRAVALALAPLSEAEAAALVGDAAATIYAQAGGNPFYLEQLARVADGGARGALTLGDVPPAVAAALAAELATLTDDARALLDAGAVAGDPFDADLAAEIADQPEATALKALDELLEHALARPGDAPRRFAFRHPVIRHAVYEAIPAGRRLAAHARAAAALERRGAGAVQRAHHVEHAARAGDEDAVALLTAAAEELQAPAPATAARFYEAALRLVPGASPDQTRIRARLADAQAAAGDPGAARETLAAALEAAAQEDRLALTVALANQEWWLGGHEDARRRLHVALGELPAEPSPDRIRLRLALALTALLGCELGEAAGHASDAGDDARAIGDPVFEVAALAAGGVAGASDARGQDAVDRVDDAAVALGRLTDAQLATRLPALWCSAAPGAPSGSSMARSPIWSAGWRSPRAPVASACCSSSRSSRWRRSSSSAAWPLPRPPPRTASSSLAWPPTRGCCSGRKPRCRPRAWRSATSTAPCGTARRRPRAARSPTSTRPACPAGAWAPRSSRPGTPSAASTRCLRPSEVRSSRACSPPTARAPQQRSSRRGSLRTTPPEPGRRLRAASRRRAHRARSGRQRRSVQPARPSSSPPAGRRTPLRPRARRPPWPLPSPPRGPGCSRAVRSLRPGAGATPSPSSPRLRRRWTASAPAAPATRRFGSCVSSATAWSAPRRTAKAGRSPPASGRSPTSSPPGAPTGRSLRSSC